MFFIRFDEARRAKRNVEPLGAQITREGMPLVLAHSGNALAQIFPVSGSTTTRPRIVFHAFAEEAQVAEELRRSPAEPSSE